MNRHVLTIAVWSMLMSTAIGQTIVDYRGLEVQSPDPTGSAGLRLQNNFKMLADRIGPTNLTATAAPTVDDDVDEGYYAGSLWYDTVGGVLYWCADNTDGAATWKDLSTAGGAAAISDAAYAASWDGVTTIAPSKNALYDYLSSLSTVYQAADADLTTWAGVTPSDNGKSLVTAADYAAMKTLLSLGTMADADGTIGVNTFLGLNAGYNVTTGTKNLLIGYMCGDNLTTGSNNIIIGYDLNATSNTVSNQINIGDVITGDTSTKALTLAGSTKITGPLVGIGRNYVADYPLAVAQVADDKCIICYGYDDRSAYNARLSVDQYGRGLIATSHQLVALAGGYINLQTAAAADLTLTAGGNIVIADVDAGGATRGTISTATGEIAIPSNTVGLKLNASGTTTIISDASNLTLTDPTTGAKTLAELATDTDTLGSIGSVANGDVLIYNSGWKRLGKGDDGQVLKLAAGLPAWAADTDTNTTYTGGDGLTLTETDFDLDLKTGGGLEIDTGQLRLSTHEAAATQAGSGATATLDFSANAIIKFTFDNNGGATTFTFTDPPAGSRCLLILIQDADGGETVTWPVAETIYWAGGTAFDPDTTAASRAVVTLVFDGTDYYCTGYDYATAP